MDIQNISFNNNHYYIITFDSNSYKLYAPYFKNKNICDPDYIDETLENLSYQSIEDEGHYGFFLFDDESKIRAVLIFDFNCTMNYNSIIKYTDINDSGEITLLCSNKKHQEKGLTFFFSKYVIENIIPQIKPIKHIFLYVAEGHNKNVPNEEKNQIAISFYKKLGFKPLQPGSRIFSYNYENHRGGKYNKTKNKRKQVRKYSCRTLRK